MKKLFFLAAAFTATIFASAQTKPDDVVKMNVETHDFGKVKQGIPVTYTFEIKNISNAPVVVENTSASCGCTTPEKPTEPIMPGESGKIKVQYNAAAVGPINKDVYIKLAGIEQTKVVKIIGEVVAAQANDNATDIVKPVEVQKVTPVTLPATAKTKTATVAKTTKTRTVSKKK